MSVYSPDEFAVDDRAAGSCTAHIPCVVQVDGATGHIQCVRDAKPSSADVRLIVKGSVSDGGIPTGYVGESYVNIFFAPDRDIHIEHLYKLTIICQRNGGNVTITTKKED